MPLELSDRRSLLKKMAATTAVVWVAPTLVRADIAAAGVFSAKCAPGAITVASATFVRTACVAASSTIVITLTFTGPCPCGGTKLWCIQKNTPTPTVFSSTATISFPVTIPIASTITITGKVALGCTDRDGDTQYAIYNWTMTARDNGRSCAGVVNSITTPVLSGRTLVNSVSCPSLAAFAPLAAPIPPPAVVRPA